MNERKITVSLEAVQAKVVYHAYRSFELKTLLVSLGEKQRVLSTREGFKRASFVANHYNPRELWDLIHDHYEEFEGRLPGILGVESEELAMLTTAADMDNLAVSETSYEEFSVCCLVTAGVKNNALRAGVDKAGSIERDGEFKSLPGTINIIILTNATLADQAMARAIITATEAKTAALQDLNVRSTYNPQNQATGTGTDGLIVVSGKGPLVRYTGGHAKMGELIGAAAKRAVTEAICNQQGKD